jgi:hypothetical protein
MEELTWQKATRSAAANGCVEVGSASDGRARGIRDSKSPERGHLPVTPEVLGGLLDDIRDGRYSLLGNQ